MWRLFILLSFSQSGVVQVNRPLDRERIAEYTLTITVKDNPENPRIARRVSTVQLFISYLHIFLSLIFHLIFYFYNSQICKLPLHIRLLINSMYLLHRG